MKTKIAVETKNLCKEFDGKSVLNHLEIRVDQGEIYGILGTNGAGKTTLLKLIAGLLEPTEGGAYVLGENSWKQRDKVLSNIGSLIEVPYFYEHLSASQNLSIHLEYMGVSADISKVLRDVGLSDTGNKPVSKFSLGMRQRLGIARSIIHRPKILLLDEPINGLDPVAIREMRELFILLKNKGMTILLSSHNLSEIEQTVERVLVIANGTLIEVANMEELKNTHQNNLENYLIGRLSGRLSGGKYND
ncbi:ABC transporter ATP-binding protein [Lysinibacillus sp. NPDC097231]|uniref:ABC transporter ATP-binding protein n=1 Tax=Lysinibacillus sp. NPDC097231 TaxID=3364142 RepID=UPI003825AF6A